MGSDFQSTLYSASWLVFRACLGALGTISCSFYCWRRFLPGENIKALLSGWVRALRDHSSRSAAHPPSGARQSHQRELPWVTTIDRAGSVHANWRQIHRTNLIVV